MHPMAWGALKPSDSNVDPAVHAVVLILYTISEHGKRNAAS